LSLKLEYDDMFYGHVASIDISCVRVDKKLFLNHEPPSNTLGPDKAPQQSAPLAAKWRPRNPRGSKGMYQCTFRFSRT